MTEKKTTTKAKTTAKPVKALHGVGRRKEAKCTVNLVKGDGESTVNGMPLEKYFTQAEHKSRIMMPFIVTNTLSLYHIKAKASGGGMSGQADSLRLGIARSLAKLGEEFHTILAKESLLTRDPRAKERKKIFLVRARKRPQYSKR